jgi:RNA polymerase sigma factor (sigma-70 family)
LLFRVVTVARAREGEAVTDFEQFTDTARPNLQRALVARYGVQIGVEATADAMAYAWEHWAKVRTMENAIGYLWRVAQTSVRRQHRWNSRLTYPDERRIAADGDVDRVELPAVLWTMRADVRVALLLVHGYGWTYDEVAALLDVPVSTVRNHVHRGLKKLRTELED